MTWYDRILDAVESAEQVVLTLNDMSVAFGETGNLIMKQRLGDASDRLGSEMDQIRNELSDHVSRTHDEIMRTDQETLIALAGDFVKQEGA